MVSFHTRKPFRMSSRRGRLQPATRATVTIRKSPTRMVIFLVKANAGDHNLGLRLNNGQSPPSRKDNKKLPRLKNERSSSAGMVIIYHHRLNAFNLIKYYNPILIILLRIAITYSIYYWAVLNGRRNNNRSSYNHQAAPAPG